MLRWSQRIREWAVVARQHAGLASGLTMLRAILSGPVPREVWRARIKTCLTCPVLDRRTMACRRVMPDGSVIGCSCFTPFLAITAAPYPKGCYARQRLPNEGWPSYRFPSRRAKVRAVLRFLFPNP
jgi:hypothetical protein